MAYDGLLAGFVAENLSGELAGSKIEKIQQPQSDQIVMQIRTSAGRRRLLIDVSSEGSRVQLTSQEFENPKEAPAFCMLLRKHIQGGRILSVSQPGKERITFIDIETLTEMGYSQTKRLIAETMGKYSNIVLTDAESGRIIDSIKRISIDVNRFRQILPGLTYVMPPVANLTNNLGYGPSTRVAAEMGADFTVFAPAVWLGEDGTPKDFHAVPLVQYDGTLEKRSFETLWDAMDFYYSRKSSTNRLVQKQSNMARTVGSLISKALLKKQRLSEELLKAEKADIYRLKGELLNANLHLVKPGDRSVKVISYYDGSSLTIELDEKLSAAKNAQNYYKRYAKAKSGRKEKLQQLSECENDISYLESVKALIESSGSFEDLETIREELSSLGYIRVRNQKERNRKQKPKPRRYRLASGLEVVVGRSNTENDYVTFKIAGKTDWWFHTKDIHGSHAVLICNGTDPSPEDMYAAASIAAWFSAARNSENVPVDYAPARHVKKPSGAKPGMVIFTDNGTVYINPRDPSELLV